MSTRRVVAAQSFKVLSLKREPLKKVVEPFISCMYYSASNPPQEVRSLDPWQAYPFFAMTLKLYKTPTTYIYSTTRAPVERKRLERSMQSACTSTNQDPSSGSA